VALAQQGDEAVGQIIAEEPSAGNHRGKLSIGNQSKDWVKQARSEEASSVSGNKRCVESDARRHITQNPRQREYGRDPADLHNIIDNRRCNMA
jgi:hypothetical protein